jgi:hypothetical protein
MNFTLDTKHIYTKVQSTYSPWKPVHLRASLPKRKTFLYEFVLTVRFPCFSPEIPKEEGEGGGSSLGDAVGNRSFQQLMITGALLSFTALTFLMDRPEAQEVSFQEFKNKLLEAGMVQKIEVLNKTIAKVGFHAPCLRGVTTSLVFVA